MPIPKADWKRQRRQILDWFMMLIAVGLLAIYLYLGWTEGEMQYFGIALLLVAWGGIYFTDIWQPILYLVVAIIVLTFTGLLFVDGSWEQRIVQAAILLNTVFVLTGIYLFVYEDPVV